MHRAEWVIPFLDLTDDYDTCPGRPKSTKIHDDEAP